MWLLLRLSLGNLGGLELTVDQAGLELRAAYLSLMLGSKASVTALVFCLFPLDKRKLRTVLFGVRNLGDFSFFLILQVSGINSCVFEALELHCPFYLRYSVTEG